MKTTFTAMLMTVVLASCGDDEPAASQADEVEELLEGAQEQLAEAREAAGEAAAEAGEDNPCDILTEAMVRAELPVPADAQIEQRRGQAATNLCSYTWPNPDFDQEEHTRRMMQRMREQMRKGKTAQGIADMAMMGRQSAEVSLTWMGELDDEAAAERQFDSAMAVLNRGVSRDIDRGPAKGQKVTFQAGTEEVEGVGDQAHWAPRMQQLSVRAGRRIFHLSVKVEDDRDANLELTKKLARALVAG